MKFPLLLLTVLVACMLVLPVAAADDAGAMTSAGALYSRSVDLANEGNYQQALDAADKALAMNVTSLTGLIQSNRAGILVMLGRNTEAIAAADAALAVEGDLTTVHAIAWYNRGNALKNLGRTGEAAEAYAKARALDSTLVPPGGDSAVTPPSSSSGPAGTVPATKSPVSLVPVAAALGVVAGGIAGTGKK